MEARVVVLGYIQRGGSPTSRDRIAASRFGAAAVRAIIEGRAPSLIGEERGEVVYVPIAETAGKHRRLDEKSLELVSSLSI
jgi:6-phosphofructokinase 1